MSRRLSEEARVLEYFEAASLEKALLMFGLVKRVMTQKGQATATAMNAHKPKAKRGRPRKPPMTDVPMMP